MSNARTQKSVKLSRTNDLPGNCVAVEDSIASIQAACAAGIEYVIDLESPGRTHVGRETNGVDLRIDIVTQIPSEDLFHGQGR